MGAGDAPQCAGQFLSPGSREGLRDRRRRRDSGRYGRFLKQRKTWAAQDARVLSSLKVSQQCSLFTDTSQQSSYSSPLAFRSQKFMSSLLLLPSAKEPIVFSHDRCQRRVIGSVEAHLCTVAKYNTIIMSSHAFATQLTARQQRVGGGVTYAPVRSVRDRQPLVMTRAAFTAE